MIDSKSIDIILESYNSVIAEKFMQSMQNVQTPKDYKNLIDEARTEWENHIIGAKTPKEIFSEISDSNLPDIFKKAAVVCDEFVPISLADNMISRCNHSSIRELAMNSQNVDVRIAAINLLGMTKKAEFTDTLVDMLYDNSEYADLVAEKARDAIISIGPKTIDYIEKRISKTEKIEGADFHILIALLEIDSERKSDKIFTMLKNGFRNTSDKALAARCIADYGDGRAVPLLRGFLARSSKTVSEDTLREIQGAVLNLGGSLEGLD